ncbi:hypothetical protein ACH5RR_012609 [Cinchona calisaya]|uniref:Uncharacterized protein n=1 Tax=Cinchona calisaya TaxID=153742 RepID=A0ABD3A8S7_9GENT
MGGCTSKPKVLKGDEAEALAPAPQKVEEEKEAVKAAATAAVVVVEGDVKKDQDGAAADDNGNKSRSLGSLFKESQEGKDSSETETVKDFVVSEGKQTEPETTREVQPKEVKQTEEQVVSLVDGLAKEVKPTEEAAPMVDVPANEVQSQGVKPTVKGECAEKTYKEPEEKSETLEEKKQEESATATEQEKAEK